MKTPTLAWLSTRVRLPQRIGWRDHVIGAALALVYVLALLVTSGSVGIGRDESVYFRAAPGYWGFWLNLFERGSAALNQGAIDRAFSDNHEHPALMKTLFGASYWLFHETWHVFADASTALRFPAMLTAGAALWTTYLFGARAWSRTAGVVAAILLGAMPRVFFHAHLACFDVPILSLWTVCIYVHWRAQERRGILWALVVGVVFGLALETKHNSWMLPFVCVPHAFFVHRHAILRGLRAGRLSIPTSVVAMAVVGPAVFLGLWPYLWADTLGRLQWYADFHLNHVYFNIEYLGRNYFGPPSPKSYLPVMVLATVPGVTLVLFGVGAVNRAVAAARRLYAWTIARTAAPEGVERVPSDPRETDLLLALSFAVAVGPFFLAHTPIFGGTKHWFPAYSALALFAGRGFDVVASAMRRTLAGWNARRLRLAEGGLVASVVIAPILITAHATPFGLSSYVPFVGGTAGGADLGLNRQFWGYTTEDAAEDYLNDRAPRGAPVFIHDTTYDAWMRMQEEGHIRRDLRAVFAPHEAQVALLQHELHMSEVDYSIWVAFGTDAPAYVVTHDGVPIVSIYRR
jgi:4-amino-4-deoxy-L-arabinose transferase-like glycosyltransferase